MANSKSTLLVAAGVAGVLALRSAVRKRRRITLAGKVALITGGSRGLGLEIARRLADKGARLALCARDPAELERAEAELTERGAEVFTYPCDVTAEPQVEALMHAVRGRFDRIDVLINNAGIIEVGPEDEMTVADYEEAMKTHFWAPLYTTCAVLPEMKARREGRIVNIASIGGKVSVPHLLPYSSSKFALVGYSEGLRSELLKYGIYVTTLCPGLMRTGSHHNAKFKGQNKAEFTLFSLGASLSITSISSESAARQVVAALEYGDAEVVLSPQAKVAATFHGLFPGLTSDFLGLVNSLLPGPGGIGRQRASGVDSHTMLSPSILTSLGDEAAQRNNEMA